METETSPPLALIAEITLATAVSEETARVPSQVGLQPPPLGARMKASWNAFCPVAFMTVIGSGGSLSNGIRYGADAYQLLLSAALALCALTRPTAVAPAAATTVTARVTNDFRGTCPPRGVRAGRSDAG